MSDLKEARVLSTESETIVQSVVGMLQKLLKKQAGASVVRKTAQGMQDAAPAPGMAKGKMPLKKAVAQKTTQGMREARLSEAGQDGMSFKDIAQAVQAAIVERIGGGYVTIRDLFAATVIYAVGWGDEADLFRVAYTVGADGAITLGDAEDVVAQVIYVTEDETAETDACPYCGSASGGDAIAQMTADIARMGEGDDDITESAQELAGDVVTLREGAVGANGQARIKLIAPGWGSSGYYSPEVLKRDGPQAFAAGTKMYWDHPTVTEEADRPERSLRDLAAQLTSGAVWQDDPTNGPGLYADAVVFPAFQEAVDSLAPHIGTSIRALGRAEAGEAEGQSGPIVTQIAAGKSVDFVTTPGAGGKVLHLFEAARGRSGVGTVPAPAPRATIKEKIVNETEAQALRESNTTLAAQLARIQEKLLLAEARGVAQTTLATLALHDATRARLLESLVAKAPIKDGALDAAAFATLITEAAQAEQTYLASLNESGAIVGMGSTSQPAAVKLDEAQAQLEGAFADLGLSATGAKLAAGK